MAVKKIALLLSVSALVLGALLNVLLPYQAAARSYDELNASQRGRSYAYYNAILGNDTIPGCVNTNGVLNNSIAADGGVRSTTSSPSNGKWFNNDSTVYVAAYDGNSAGAVKCSSAIEKAAADYWGVSTTDLLKGLGYVWNDGAWKMSGDTEAGLAKKRGENLKTFLKSSGVNTVELNWIKYWNYNNAFLLTCDAQLSGTSSSINIADGYTIVEKYPVIDSPTNKIKEFTYAYKDGPTVYSVLGKGVTCKNIATYLTSNEASYGIAGYLDQLYGDKCVEVHPKYIGEPDLIAACAAGAKNKDSKDYCTSSPTISKTADALKACLEGQQLKLEEKDLPNTDSFLDNSIPDEEMTSCRIDGVGWLLCPVLVFAGGVTDAAYEFVSSLLKTQPLLTTGESSGVYEAWKVMRNFANGAFVIAFLIIIFSQLTGSGVSNYGVKKMLPRLVISAILVNISFFICAIAVDISNILGISMTSLFGTIQIPTEVKVDGISSGEGWAGIVGAVITGAAVGTAAVYIGLSALIPALLVVVVSILTVFIVLIARQALIILLVTVAPLAFVAYLLPNTEDLFNKWRKLFTTLLLMFPVIAIIFGASALASKIVMGSADNTFVQIAGAAIAIVPLALTPIIMKSAGGVLNRIGGFVNNKNRGPFDSMRKSAEAYRKDKKNLSTMRALQGKGLPGKSSYARWRARRGAISSGRESELNRARSEYVSGEIPKSNSGFANAAAGGSMFGSAGNDATQRAIAGAINTTAKLELEEITAAGVVLKNAKLDQREIRRLSKGEDVTKNGMKLSGSGAMRAAAIQQTVASNDISHINELWNESKDWGDNKEHNTLRQALADSLASSSSRPAYIGQGAISALRTGTNTTIEQTIKDAVAANAYSPEKIVSADKDELATVISTINSASDVTDDAKQAFMLNAEKALTDDNLSVKISKNRDEIKNILGIS